MRIWKKKNYERTDSLPYPAVRNTKSQEAIFARFVRGPARPADYITDSSLTPESVFISLLKLLYKKNRSFINH